MAHSLWLRTSHPLPPPHPTKSLFDLSWRGHTSCTLCVITVIQLPSSLETSLLYTRRWGRRTGILFLVTLAKLLPLKSSMKASITDSVLTLVSKNVDPLGTMWRLVCFVLVLSSFHEVTDGMSSFTNYHLHLNACWWRRHVETHASKLSRSCNYCRSQVPLYSVWNETIRDFFYISMLFLSLWITKL